VKEIINNRTITNAKGEPEPKLSYVTEVHGGRVRPDGTELQWMVTFPLLSTRGVLPFFCRDLTPRERRVCAYLLIYLLTIYVLSLTNDQAQVPTNPSINTAHSSTALGIAFIRVSYPTEDGQFGDMSKRISDAIGTFPNIVSQDDSLENHEWELDVPLDFTGTLTPKPRLILTPLWLEGEERVGIYEVGIFAKGTDAGKAQTNVEDKDVGRIIWVRI